MGLDPPCYPTEVRGSTVRSGLVTGGLAHVFPVYVALTPGPRVLQPEWPAVSHSGGGYPGV